jgi:hypothetical protein
LSSVAAVECTRAYLAGSGASPISRRAQQQNQNQDFQHRNFYFAPAIRRWSLLVSLCVSLRRR